MLVGSLFAGIDGFGLACRQTGMDTVWTAEKDANCNSVRKRQRPNERTVECVTAVRGPDFRCDLLTAGWPCQGNSVAGKRAGMADTRSGLWSEVVTVLGEQRPRWFLGENVPGLLSVNGGWDFGAVLGDLAELGYGFAYRVLDAQWFGVAQRRRRVFLVGCLGDWRRAAEVLFESESLPWHPAPSREPGARVAASLTRGTDSSGKGGYAGRRQEDDMNIVAGCLNSGGCEGGLRTEPGEHLVTHTLRAEGHDASEDGTGRGTPIVPVASNAMRVRRLTPLECEKLQGFPPGWTQFGANGKQISDSARYRMLGNAVAVPVVRWIADKITVH